MINVLIVHEMPLICNVLASSLADEPGIHIVGDATTVEEAAAKIDNGSVDVVLVSSRLPDQGTIRLINDINELDPAIKLVVIGVTETKNTVLHFLEAGASGYVAKDSTVEELVSVIRMANDNRVDVPPRITAALIERLSNYAQIFSDLEISVVENAELTDRELDVLELLGEGMTNNQIASELYIETGTVKNHVHSILDKLNVSSRKEAATYLALLER